MAKQRIASTIARHNRSFWAENLYRLAAFYRKAYLNFNYDFQTNGEEYILSCLPAFSGNIFDVGANEGEWSRMVAKRFPDARVTAFEPILNTYEALKKATKDVAAIQAINFGLSDKTEERDFAHHEKYNQLASVIIEGYTEIHKKPENIIRCKLIRGDDFCRENSISKIDYLKIDAEGHEGAILNGLRDMLAGNNINIIQFEYGRLNIYSKFLLKDFYDLLQDKYAIGKIYPDGVDFKSYSSLDEDFLGPNYLAVHKKEEALIEKLKRLK